MAPRQVSDNTDMDENVEFPMYHNNPILLRSHLLKLYPALAKRDSNYDTLVKCGYMVAGRLTICWSAEHAEALSDGTINMGNTTYSWDKPMPLATYQPMSRSEQK